MQRMKWVLLADKNLAGQSKFLAQQSKIKPKIACQIKGEIKF